MHTSRASRGHGLNLLHEFGHSSTDWPRVGARIAALAASVVVSSCQSSTPTPPVANSALLRVNQPVQPSNAAGKVGRSTAEGSFAGAAPTAETKPLAISHCPRIQPLPDPSPGQSCGPLGCLRFPRAEDALAYVMRETQPVVLAIGEIHAQKNAPLKASPTARFSALLPIFCGRARHIVIELWTGRNDCGDKRVDEVRETQKPITQAQAVSNQNDFLELGNVAKSLQIQPHALVPTCEDYQSILGAKEQDIARMLELTATRTADLAEQLLNRPNVGEHSPNIILYGGAMHNDLSPAVGRESFSYGPRLQTSTNRRLTEVDIVLREQVKDTESFQRFPWYAHFRAETLEKHYVLYQVGARSFALIYPNQSYLP